MHQIREGAIKRKQTTRNAFKNLLTKTKEQITDEENKTTIISNKEAKNSDRRKSITREPSGIY